MLGDEQTQQAWMRFANEQQIPHDHEDEDVYKRGFVAGRNVLAAEVKRLDKWRVAMEELTPQGSEFHNDLDACLAYIQKRRQSDHDTIKKKHKELALTKAKLERAMECVEHYADNEHLLWLCGQDQCSDFGHVCGYNAEHRSTYYDSTGNGYDFARQIKAEIEEMK
jgi:hypothetical protein